MWEDDSCSERESQAGRLTPMSPLGSDRASALTFGERVDQPSRRRGPENSYARRLYIPANTVLHASILASFLFSPPSILLTTCPASSEIEYPGNEFVDLCHQLLVSGPQKSSLRLPKRHCRCFCRNAKELDRLSVPNDEPQQTHTAENDPLSFTSPRYFNLHLCCDDSPLRDLQFAEAQSVNTGDATLDRTDVARVDGRSNPYCCL
ncbi:hypothetical protein EYF80_025588 [Liparis tanakae]|uniref:Uncharacterized protein n=1 Tax=Liparis tanakae TaxID=230148 RepID=A0A4Z2HF94_9TELE|nr:hypothetical protein EYF80_025588 [Liparis tanakae]